MNTGQENNFYHINVLPIKKIRKYFTYVKSTRYIMNGNNEKNALKPDLHRKTSVIFNNAI